MRAFSRWAGGLALAAMMASAATPAMADRGWGGGYRHHDRGGGFGTFVGVAALLGAVAVIASSASKDRKAERGRSYDPSYDRPNYGYGSPADMQASTGSEDAAVDDCAVAARNEGARDGSYAEMRGITSTRAVDGGWDVDGTVDQRASYSGDGITRRFSCSWREGHVSDLILSRDSVALR